MRTVAVVNGKPRMLGGWKPDTYDHRDFILKAPAPALSSSTLRPNWRLNIRDQGARGTCTANGTLEAYGYDCVRDSKSDPVLSRLFTYWVSRVKMENTPATDDSGCQIRDVVNGLRTYGSCPESMWPYSDDDTTFTLTPPSPCFAEAMNHRAVFFYRCPDLNTIKASIAQGFPVIMGFNVPENFMSPECAATGIVKMPAPTEGFVGGHCMVYAGWDDATKMLTGPNSWGTGWGDQGWFYMPYDFVNQGFVSDCWTLRRVME